MKTVKMKNNGRPCAVYEYNGWYVVRGGTGVNRTDPECLQPGVDVNDNFAVQGYDFFSWHKQIMSMRELIYAVKH
ncbi:hypothetical protein [Bacteroides sp.]|uniref:hypothetical protein n=1 Tax=Bacteroides sp. TaxID=29523 RepID=UPI002A83AC8E|nr:hypothetical protein [Bacteroides sp.]